MDAVKIIDDGHLSLWFIFPVIIINTNHCTSTLFNHIKVHTINFLYFVPQRFLQNDQCYSVIIFFKNPLQREIVSLL